MGEGGPTSLGKSVFSRGEADFQYNFGKCLRDKRVGDNEKWCFRGRRFPGQMERVMGSVLRYPTWAIWRLRGRIWLLDLFLGKWEINSMR